MYDVMIRYEDGRRTKVQDEIDDLGEACAFVLKLAEQLGHASDSKGIARSVEIYREDRLEISVSVVRGGLSSQGTERSPRAG